MYEQKKFSVVIPVYNREHLIEETVNSVLAQTFTDYELIVIDDGSTDQTPVLLKQYGRSIRLFSQENRGPEAARFNGIQEARGEYLVFLDSDDLFLPHTLATYDLVTRKLDNPAVMLGAMVRLKSDRISEVASKLESETETVKVFSFSDYLSKNISTSVSNSKIVIKKTVYDTIYTPERQREKTFPIDDFNILMLCGASGPCVVMAEPATVICRSHQGNTIKNFLLMYNGVLSFIKAEWCGRFPGGAKRCFDRHARMGGTVYEHYRMAVRNRHFYYAVKIFAIGWPMIVVAFLKKIWPWRRKPVPIEICCETER